MEEKDAVLSELSNFLCPEQSLQIEFTDINIPDDMFATFAIIPTS